MCHLIINFYSFIFMRAEVATGQFGCSEFTYFVDIN